LTHKYLIYLIHRMWDFYLLTDKRSVKIKEMIVSDI